jgi:putative endonuclease
MFTVYVLRNEQGRLYVGQTANIEQRLVEHMSGLSTRTRSRGPWELVHQEQFETRADAMARERALKSGRENMALRQRFGLKRNASPLDEALD